MLTQLPLQTQIPERSQHTTFLRLCCFVLLAPAPPTGDLPPGDLWTLLSKNPVVDYFAVFTHCTQAAGVAMANRRKVYVVGVGMTKVFCGEGLVIFSGLLCL